MMITNIQSIAYHRNGISGAPFHVVLFDEVQDVPSRKVAIVFGERYHVAVLDIDLLHRSIIEFGVNSWRGDLYEPKLREQILAYDAMRERDHN